MTALRRWLALLLLIFLPLQTWAGTYGLCAACVTPSAPTTATACHDAAGHAAHKPARLADSGCHHCCAACALPAGATIRCAAVADRPAAAPSEPFRGFTPAGPDRPPSPTLA